MTALRWLIRGLVGTLALAVVGLGTLWVLSERALGKVPTVMTATLVVRNDSQTIAHGRRVARTRGCFGCHGQALEGTVFSEWAWTDRAIAPALGPIAREASNETLDRIIRHGIGRNDKALWSMPSYNFRRLADDDLAALIAFLRSVDTPAAELPSARLGLSARLALVLGQETHMATWSEAVPPLSVDPRLYPQLARGEYLAMTSCNECHGLDLRGQTQYGSTPDLSILAAYSRDEFEQLMRRGISRDGRGDLPLMSMIARDRFGTWTDDEVDALFAFLRTLPGREVPRGVFWRP